MRVSKTEQDYRGVLVVLLLLIFTSLGSGIAFSQVDEYSPREAGKSQPATRGVVIDVQTVTIQPNSDKSQAIGAAVGSIVANQATRDSSGVVRATATTIGAIGGAVAGDAVASEVLSDEGQELIVELESGDAISITQQAGSAVFAVGDLVWVIRGSQKTRVTPRSR